MFDVQEEEFKFVWMIEYFHMDFFFLLEFSMREDHRRYYYRNTTTRQKKFDENLKTH